MTILFSILVLYAVLLTVGYLKLKKAHLRKIGAQSGQESTKSNSSQFQKLPAQPGQEQSEREAERRRAEQQAMAEIFVQKIFSDLQSDKALSRKDAERRSSLPTSLTETP